MSPVPLWGNIRRATDFWATSRLKVRVSSLHNSVRAGLVSRPEDSQWSRYNEYAGVSAEESVSRRTV
jgi:hypothetical protein